MLTRIYEKKCDDIVSRRLPFEKEQRLVYRKASIFMFEHKVAINNEANFTKANNTRRGVHVNFYNGFLQWRHTV